VIPPRSRKSLHGTVNRPSRSHRQRLKCVADVAQLVAKYPQTQRRKNEMVGEKERERRYVARRISHEVETRQKVIPGWGH
jgi:hypothetical protein